MLLGQKSIEPNLRNEDLWNQESMLSTKRLETKYGGGKFIEDDEKLPMIKEKR